MTAKRKPATRTRTGCLPCRKRGKKCDERKPICRGCERNILICGWPSELPQVAASELPNRDISHGVHKQNVKPSGHMTQRPWNYPPCSLESAFNLLKEPTYHSSLVNLNPESRLLMDHYLHRSACIMSPSQGRANPFLSLIIPIALNNDLVLHSLLTFSGIHYSEQGSNLVSPNTWSHYAHTVKGLKYALTEHASGVDMNIIPLLMAVFMFIYVEAIREDGVHGMLLVHLRAARQILFRALETPTPYLDTDARRFLIDAYLYATITCNISFGPSSNQWISDDTAILHPVSQTNSNQNPSICVCSPEIFELIPLASSLASKKAAEVERLGVVSWETTSSLLSLRGKIQRWKSDSTDPEIVACQKIYQQALLVYLDMAIMNEQPIDGYPLPIQQAFDTLIKCLEQLPVNSPNATTLCWPLFVFGTCAKSESHRAMISQTLLDLHSVIGCNNIKGTLRFLETVWSRRDRSHGPLRISGLLAEQNTELYFL